MKSIVFIFLILGFFSIQISCEIWKAEEIPNPTKFPEKCGRKDGISSFICNPDQILTSNGMIRMEEKLQFIKQNRKHICGSEPQGYEIGIAFIDAMNIMSSEEKEAAARRFAKNLHDSWGVGNKDCNNGVMIFLSKVFIFDFFFLYLLFQARMTSKSIFLLVLVQCIF